MISLLLLLSCGLPSEISRDKADKVDKAIVRTCSGSFSYTPRQPGLNPYRPAPPPPPPEPGLTEKAGKAWDDFWKDRAKLPAGEEEEALGPPVGGGSRRDSSGARPKKEGGRVSKKPAASTGASTGASAGAPVEPSRFQPPITPADGLIGSRGTNRGSRGSEALMEPAPATAIGGTGSAEGLGDFGLSGGGIGGGGSVDGLGGLGTKGIGSGSSGYGSGGGNLGSPGSSPRSEAGGAIVQEAKPVVVAAASEGWGDEIHLSNDDSMSLASAQRLLWAAEKGSMIRSNEVRPHELLNYFHFDTQAPTEGQLFGVKGSAVADEKGKITLAFAVAGAIPVRRPLDLTLVLDRSGSMRDEGRMDYLKRGLLKMREQLVEGDRVDMVLFDTEVCTPLENYVVGRDDPALLTDAINALEPRGGTDVDIGLKEGYAIAGAQAPSDRNRRMLLITDALLNTGDVNPDTVTQIGKAYDESGIRLSGIGVGRQFNDSFLDKLTEKGRGPYVYLGSEAVVDRVFGSSFVSLTQSLAEDVRFSIDLPESLAMARFYGEEASTVEADIQPIHYQAGTTQLFLQDLKVRDTGISKADPLSFRIRWKEPGSTEERSQIWTSTLGELLGAEPRSIYKARAIMAWSDMAMSRPLRTESCTNLWTNFQNRTTVAGEDAELAYLSTLTGRLCDGGGGWTSAQTEVLAGSNGGGRSFGALSIGTPIVKGQADKNVVLRVIKHNYNIIRYCHQRLLLQDPNLNGTVSLQFVIGADGSTLQTTVKKNTTNNTELENCLTGRFRRMMFPEDPGGGPSIVSIDLTFVL